MWARIESGRVTELTDIDPEGRFHESLVWIDCDNTITPGMNYDGSTFSEDELTLDEIKDQKCDSMLQSFNQAVAEDVTYNAVVYQSGDRARENLVMAIANYISAANSLPANFEWIAKNNTQTSFSTTDIIGLAEVIGDQWSAAFANFQARKDEIRAVSTGDDAADIITVNAIGW